MSLSPFIGVDPAQVLPDGTPRSGNADYDSLPRCIKDTTSYEQWQWLSGAEKGGLVQHETEPEY